jgi:hypothetical protein
MMRLVYTINLKWVGERNATDENGRRCITFRVVTKDAKEHFIDWLVRPRVDYMGKCFRIDFDHKGVKFNVNIKRAPKAVSLDHDGFFYGIPYDPTSETLSAEDIFYFGETFALGCCELGKTLFTSQISDVHAKLVSFTISKENFENESPYIKRVRYDACDDVTFGLLVYTSTWNMLWRGSTYYENKGYKLQLEEPFATVSQKIGEFMSKTIFEIGAKLVDQTYDVEASKTITVRDIVEAVVTANGFKLVLYFSLLYPAFIECSPYVSIPHVDKLFNEFQHIFRRRTKFASSTANKDFVVSDSTVSRLIFFNEFEILGVRAGPNKYTPLMETAYAIVLSRIRKEYRKVLALRTKLEEYIDTNVQSAENAFAKQLREKFDKLMPLLDEGMVGTLNYENLVDLDGRLRDLLLNERKILEFTPM